MVSATVTLSLHLAHVCNADGGVVESLSDRFEQLVWRVVDRYIEYAKERSSVLVKVAQVMWREQQWLAERLDVMTPADRAAAHDVPRTEGQVRTSLPLVCA